METFLEQGRGGGGGGTHACEKQRNIKMNVFFLTSFGVTSTAGSRRGDGCIVGG